jgi:hypothetical protein
LRFTLTRGQRLAQELPPWAPAIAGGLGFVIGVAVLTVDVSRWFMLLLLVPILLYRGLFALALDVLLHSRLLVEIAVDETDLCLHVSGQRKILPLSGIIQVFRSGDAWTVLHFSGDVLTISVDAVSEPQIEYLKSFARQAAAERKAAQTE